MFSMSWWGGGKKDSTKDAIVSLRTHIEMLSKREAFYEKKIEEQTKLAKSLVTTNKSAARNALRRKKKHEEELEKTQNQVIMFEQQLGALENANLNKETMKVMKQGAAAMKQINKGMDIDKLDNTMEDMRDQVALHEEISDAISRPLQEEDTLDLEQDLEELEQEALDERMVGAGRAPASVLPEVPTGESKDKESEANGEDEDEELKQLEAEMAA